MERRLHPSFGEVDVLLGPPEAHWSVPGKLQGCEAKESHRTKLTRRFVSVPMPLGRFSIKSLIESHRERREPLDGGYTVAKKKAAKKAAKKVAKKPAKKKACKC